MILEGGAHKLAAYLPGFFDGITTCVFASTATTIYLRRLEVTALRETANAIRKNGYMASRADSAEKIADLEAQDTTKHSLWIQRKMTSRRILDTIRTSRNPGPKKN